ncbi:MAG: outer membrane beta-barrel domain-containing protein [Deltaproteobacteria bacterium]|nr:outer membrane beta-barrel domain-containing protein [Deltaproteobacteria bacterium]
MSARFRHLIRTWGRVVTVAAAAACPLLAHAADEADPPAAAKLAEAPADSDAAKRTSLTRELAEQGEADLQKSVRVFQQRYLVKSGRVELQLGGGLSMADPLVSHRAADATLLVHLSERLAIGAGASKWFGQTTARFAQIERDFGLFPEKSLLQAGGHGQVQLTPLVGKFSSFGIAVLQVDGYVLLGGGALRTTRGETLKPFGMAGAGLRIHTLRWLSLSFEVRDYITSEKFISESRILQHVFGGVQLGIWIPPSVTYRFAR